MSLFRSCDERASCLEVMLIASVVVVAVAFELFVRGVRFVLLRKP